MQKLECVICGGRSRRLRAGKRSFVSPVCKNCAERLDGLELIERGKNIRAARNRSRLYRVRWRKSKWLKSLQKIERHNQKTEKKQGLLDYEISDAVKLRYGEQHVSDPQYRQMVELDALAGLGVFMDTEKLAAKNDNERLDCEKAWRQELDKLHFEYQRKRISEIVENNPGIGAKRIMKLITNKETGKAPISKSTVDRILRSLKAA